VLLRKFRIIVLDRDGHAVIRKRCLFSVEKDRMTLKQAIVNSIDSRCCGEKQGKGNHEQFEKLVSGVAIPESLSPSICKAMGAAAGFVEESWRRHPDSNRRISALQAVALPLGYAAKKMERETRFELATSTLARSHSTTELFPLNQRSVN
jgi:hypothetical protein